MEDAGSDDGQAVDVTPTKKTKSGKAVLVVQSPDATPTNKGSRKKVKVVEPESPVAVKSVKKPKQYAVDDGDASPAPKSDRNTKGDVGEPVMLLDCQDIELRPLYEKLPKLKCVGSVVILPLVLIIWSSPRRKFCDVQPISSFGGEESARVCYTDVYSGLTDPARR